MKPQRVSEGVYMVGGSDMTDPKDCSVYVVDAGELVLIDSGAGTSVGKIVQNMESVGLDPARLSTIILTHCHIDHVGGASALRDLFGAKLVIHEAEAPVLERGDDRMTAAFWYGIRFKPLPVDIALTGERQSLFAGGSEFVCLHTPGHSPGSISVYVDHHGTRILFGQDIHGPFLEEFGADLAAWTRSMHQLLDLKADILCEGHFGVYQPNTRVTAYIERYLDEYGEEQ